MDASPITREELVQFAQQVLLLAFFAGVIGGMVSDVVWHGLGYVVDWLVNRAERKARVAAAKARAARGMGQRPMLDPSHPTFPDQGAGGELGCVSKFGERFTQAQGDGGRVVKRSDDPRPLNLDQANPFPCLKEKRAEGAPALRSAHGDGGYSVETPSVLEELTPSPPRPPLSPFPVLHSAHGDGGCSGEPPSGLEELAASPPRFLRTV